MPPVGTFGDRGLTARDGGTSGRYAAGPLFDPRGLPDRADLTPLAMRLAPRYALSPRTPVPEAEHNVGGHAVRAAYAVDSGRAQRSVRVRCAKRALCAPGTLWRWRLLDLKQTLHG